MPVSVMLIQYTQANNDNTLLHLVSGHRLKERKTVRYHDDWHSLPYRAAMYERYTYTYTRTVQMTHTNNGTARDLIR